MKIIEIDKMQFVELYLSTMFSNRNLYIKMMSGLNLLNVYDYNINLSELKNARVFANEFSLLEYQKGELSSEED